MAPLCYRHEAIAFFGELIGTTTFIFGALGAAKVAIASRTPDQIAVAGTALDGQTLVFISLGFGLALISSAWTFYRVSGALFNPAICLHLLLVGAISPFRAAHTALAQFLGAMAGAGLIAALLPGDVSMVICRLHRDSIAQGIWLEAFATGILCICVTMLAAEKHKATFLAPVAIGITLFAMHLVTALWTGAALNPARALAPSVISAQFPREHYVYYAGPFIGAIIAAAIYTLLKMFDYSSVSAAQDSDNAELSPHGVRLSQLAFMRQQRAVLMASAAASAVSMAHAPTLTNEKGAVLPASSALMALDLGVEIDGAPTADPLSMNSVAQQSGGIGTPGTHLSALGALMERSGTAAAMERSTTAVSSA